MPSSAITSAGGRPLLATLELWTSVLAALAATDPDPRRRFRSQYDAGNYHAALEALHQLEAPLRGADDIERQLHCLSEAGNSADYRAVLLANAELLRVCPMTTPGSAGPGRDVAALFARVSLVLPDGRGDERNGFLAGDGLVCTTGDGLDEPGSIRVRVGASTYAVADIRRPEPATGNLAVLALAELPPSLTVTGRCGYAKSVRIGDRVWAFAAAEEGQAPLLVPGLVDMIEAEPGGPPHAFRVGMKAGPRSGGPLLNELGEIVGVLTAEYGGADSPSNSVIALAGDVLRPLLTAMA
jgi:hypothetical protein